MSDLPLPPSASAPVVNGPWPEASARQGNTLTFLGCRFRTASMEEAVRGILNEPRGAFKYVVTPNVHHIVKMHDDPAMMQPLYERAWSVFCDSRVLSWLARLSGRKLPVVTGSDLTARLIPRAAEQRLPIAVIGSSPEDCLTLEKRFPGLDIAVHTPPMGFIKSEDEIRKCVDFVVKTQAPLVFLAVGMPNQEILAIHIADHPKAQGIGLCIGASIDFLTGKQRRAPVWVQKTGLEWLHRLLSNPRRLASRYLIDCPRIFYLMYRAHKTQAGFL
jgi:N-acetylglucosaminyldiphosphoundecaprenol N-acetyl-beta-D-mannosaminyltransferase